MIVCNRCGFENPDGRNLCSRCRAYLGWVRAGGTVAVDPITEDATAASAPVPMSPPPAGLGTNDVPPSPPPDVGSTVTSTQLWPPRPPATPAELRPPATPVEHRPTPPALPRRPPALPDVTPRSAPTPIPLPPTARPEPPWSAPAPVPPPATPVADRSPRATPPPIAPNPWDVPVPPEPAASPPSDRGWNPTPPDFRREVISPGPTTPRQVTSYQLNSIPTTIAETPTRYVPTVPRMPGSTDEPGEPSFGAVRPDDRRRSAGGTTGTAGAAADAGASGLLLADLDADGERCRQCGRAVPAGRRFCRCGATLVAPAAEQDWDDGPERLPWWQRLQDAANGAARFRRTMRIANGGLRVQFSAPRAVKQRVMQLAFALGLSGVLVSQLGPWGADLRREAWDRVSALLPWSYTTMAAQTATTDPAADPTAGFAPDNAVDRDTGTAWATGWTPVVTDPTTVDPTATSAASPVAGAPCARTGGAALLVVGFDTPVAVDRVSVYPGMPAGSGTRDLQNRPKLIDVRLSDGGCREIAVPDVSAEVSVDITGRDITSITVTVVDVYPGDPTSDAGTLVAITEVVPAHR